jgi:acyl-CoA synthetase (AMP-forming)/AMP-acid ligase II
MCAGLRPADRRRSATLLLSNQGASRFNPGVPRQQVPDGLHIPPTLYTPEESLISNTIGRPLGWPRTVPQWWSQIVARHAELEMIRHEGRSATYAQVDARSAAIARGLLGEGAGKGSRIGLLAPNGADWVACWLAIERIGGVAVALSTFSSASELAYALRHADVAILLCASRYLRHDYQARLEEAFPGLASSRGDTPLSLPDCPYLRRIWVVGDEAPAWSAGSLADLAERGADSAAISETLLAAVEGNVSSADLATIIYTSGSTAQPKGVVHTQATVVDKTHFMATAGGITPIGVRQGDRCMVTSPLFWIGGFLASFGAFANGATILCVDDHSPKSILEAVRREGATQLSAPKAQLRTLMDSDDFQEGDFDNLRSFNVNQAEFFSSGVDRARLPNSLGMTETFGPHTGEALGGLLPPSSAASFGRVLDRMEIKIVDVDTRAPLPPGSSGELCVRGPWLMDGFYKRTRDEVFDVDGFYPTGDRCRLDRAGYLYFEGRLGGMIKTSGANVSADEVEAAIRAVDGVVEVAVFGVADPKLDQRVVAVVALAKGSGLSETGLRQRLGGELSSFKIPKQIVFMDAGDFPRTPSNKIHKLTLAALLEKRAAGFQA